MIPYLRLPFNADWSEAKYDRFLKLLEQRFGEPPQFRHSETPCFLTETLVNKASTAGSEMVHQLLANSDYLTQARAAIPDAYLAQGDDARPLFVQADFGLDAEANLKLVEIQGFPSLYAYQPVLWEAYREAYKLDDSLWSLPGNLSSADYESLLNGAIVSDHDPETVVLLEVDPDNQKTRHDFVATSQLLRIQVVDARAVIKQGNRLFYERDARLVPIERIYNRVIADELDRRKIPLPFSFRDDLNVEWAGHPNWFYLLSKFSLPFFRHPAAPACYFLDEAKHVEDLSAYVLKPLYSFAGTGVVIGPTQADLDAVAPEHRHDYVLQERVNFTPCVETPYGPTKIEIRVMYIWLEELRPVNLIIRMGRGAQMGVDHNKDLRWVGASAAFIQTGDK